MCRMVNYLYKCNHTHDASEPCQHAASGYPCQGRQQGKTLALSDVCPGCSEPYRKWLALQASGNEKKRMAKEQDESRKLNDWYRSTLFEPTA